MRYEDFSRLAAEQTAIRAEAVPKIEALRAQAQELEDGVRQRLTARIELVKSRERVVGGVNYEEYSRRTLVLGERVFALGRQHGRVFKQPSVRGTVETAEVNLVLPVDGESHGLHLIVDATRFYTRTSLPTTYALNAAWLNYRAAPAVEYHAAEAPSPEQYNERPVGRMLALAAVGEAVDFAETYIADHGLPIVPAPNISTP